MDLLVIVDPLDIQEQRAIADLRVIVDILDLRVIQV